MHGKMIAVDVAITIAVISFWMMMMRVVRLPILVAIFPTKTIPLDNGTIMVGFSLVVANMEFVQNQGGAILMEMDHQQQLIWLLQIAAQFLRHI